MSAADIPEARPESGFAFARILVKTVHSDREVQLRVLEDFQTAPALRTIAMLREEYRNPPRREPERPFKAHEGYYPTDAARSLDATNKRFLRKLAAERAASRIAKDRALGSAAYVA